MTVVYSAEMTKEAVKRLLEGNSQTYDIPLSDMHEMLDYLDAPNFIKITSLDSLDDFILDMISYYQQTDGEIGWDS